MLFLVYLHKNIIKLAPVLSVHVAVTKPHSLGVWAADIHLLSVLGADVRGPGGPRGLG